VAPCTGSFGYFQRSKVSGRILLKFGEQEEAGVELSGAYVSEYGFRERKRD
jgi:hypothetical protein